MKRRQQRHGARRQSLLYAAALVAVVVLLVREGGDDRGATPLPQAARAPSSEQGWEQWQTEADPAAPQDEPQRGHTASGTPVWQRDDDSFPVEPRNLFHEMDQIVGPTGQLEPFDFTDGAPVPADARVTPDARDAIRGKNSWMLWAGGNDEFWNWAQQHGFGLVDFLVLLDSRQRAFRFRDRGMINQPGMRAQTDPARKLLGLYLDEANGDEILLRPPEADADVGMSEPPRPQPTGLYEPFEPGDRELYEDTIQRLPKDGVDPLVYGYPSGVIGLRLMLNPDFFGNTTEAGEARLRWKERVEDSSDAFYDLARDVHGDPKLVRPFRVGMSCAYCHVAPHPLNPPADPAEPAWSNLSSTIGNQYWTPVRLFANLTDEKSFFFHFLNSQQPGTVDTSLLSSDHINNSNTINAVFDLPARVDRAMRNPPEEQGRASLLVPSLEESDARVTPRHTPRMLVDGGDSIGAVASVARVYLNIGTFSEEWARTSRPIIGFRGQRPFSVASLRANSVYWRTSLKYRVPAILDYFLYENPRTGANVAPPMPLASARGAPPISEEERARASAGRAVFIANCAICHSSKQPEGFALQFADDWEEHSGSTAWPFTRLVLPRTFADWERFTNSAAYAGYVRQISTIAGTPADTPAAATDPFLEDNFLSTDIRVPVTLVGTNSQRAVGTNAMRGQVWDNFSSEDYKSLPAVGPVHFYNPYSGAPLDVWGNNDVYYPPSGGPGYYRPPSLIGLWATAPYLHNNALGLLNRDPSIEGRLLAFEDGIDKLLWKDRRQPSANSRPGDLRLTHPELAGNDPGFIYRTTAESCFIFREPFIRSLFESVLGPFGTRVATLYLWIALAAACLVFAAAGRARHAAFALFLIAVLNAAVLVVTRLDYVFGIWPWVGPVATVAVAVVLLFWARDRRRWLARATFALLAALSLYLGWWLNEFTSGRRGDLIVGPIPKGTPVSLVINASSSAAGGDIANGLSALLRAGFKARLLAAHKPCVEVEADRVTDADVLAEFEREAGLALLRINKSPDFVLDRGHWFAEPLSDDEKRQLKAFLRTL